LLKFPLGLRPRPPTWIEGPLRGREGRGGKERGGKGRGGERSYQLFCPPTFRMLPPPMVAISQSLSSAIAWEDCSKDTPETRNMAIYS